MQKVIPNVKLLLLHFWTHYKKYSLNLAIKFSAFRHFQIFWNVSLGNIRTGRSEIYTNVFWKYTILIHPEDILHLFVFLHLPWSWLWLESHPEITDYSLLHQTPDTVSRARPRDVLLSWTCTQSWIMWKWEWEIYLKSKICTVDKIKRMLRSSGERKFLRSSIRMNHLNGCPKIDQFQRSFCTNDESLKGSE